VHKIDYIMGSAAILLGMRTRHSENRAKESMHRPVWIGWIVGPLLGPLPMFRTRWPLAAGAVLLVILLTLVTQIGGLVLWLAWPLLQWTRGRLRDRSVRASRAAALAIFLLLYALVSTFVVPPMAAALGRERLPCFATAERPLQAVSPLFCLTNRNYARPAVLRLLADLSDAMAQAAPGAVTAYLDAGFPFLDGFPMLPHLSHRHGRDVDLAFFYLRRDAATPSPAGGSWPIGYWAYVLPRAGDPQPCTARMVDLRWDLDWLQPAFEGVRLDERRTAAMLRWLSDNASRYGIRKILLEPHLQRRLATDVRLVRFQGCRAARHDDHLHVQTR